MDKTCTKCGHEKSIDDFSFKNTKKGTRQSSCKECCSGSSKSNYINNKQAHLDRNKIACEKRTRYIRELKEANPCMDCKQSYPHYVMEFDHKEDKLFAVSSAISWSWKKLLSEITKCDILCSNCHAVRTWERRNKPS